MNDFDVVKGYSSEIESLIDLINGIDENEICYIPNRDDGWTIKKHLLHIVNVELQGVLRNMISRSHDNHVGKILDGKTWINSDIENSVNTETIINALLSLMKLNSELITNDAELFSQFVKFTYQDNDIQFSLSDNFEASIKHIKYHKDFIAENLLEYKENLS